MSFESEAVCTDSDSDVQEADFFGGYGEAYEVADFLSLGINPVGPTLAKPGSDQKVIMLAARYAAGVPLWHNSDCYDHGPGKLVLDED